MTYREKRNAYNRAYYKRHVEEIRKRRSLKKQSPERLAMKREMYRSNPSYRRKIKASNVKRELGISLEEYEARREEQRIAGDLCGLCKQPLSNVDAIPTLDHDHDTMQIREFLHRSCNFALGLLKDDPTVCRLAAEYLERHVKYGKCQ